MVRDHKLRDTVNFTEFHEVLTCTVIGYFGFIISTYKELRSYVASIHVTAVCFEKNCIGVNVNSSSPNQSKLEQLEVCMCRSSNYICIYTIMYYMSLFWLSF